MPDVPGKAWHDAAVSTAQFECPRCQRPATERFFGPCTSCRQELRATIGSEARAVDAPAYEPKMNVVPNQVALKE